MEQEIEARLSKRPQQKIPEIGAKLASRRILGIGRRKRFNTIALLQAPDKFERIIQFVKDALKALIAAEFEIFELRYRHRKAKRALQKQTISEIKLRMKVEQRHANDPRVIQAYKGMMTLINSLQL